MLARTGIAAATAASVPPAMIISPAASARDTPPDTGASTKDSPRSASRAASARLSSRCDDDMSITEAAAAVIQQAVHHGADRRAVGKHGDDHVASGKIGQPLAETCRREGGRGGQGRAR